MSLQILSLEVMISSLTLVNFPGFSDFETTEKVPNILIEIFSPIIHFHFLHNIFKVE